MLQITLYGAISGFALVFGAIFGVLLKFEKKVVASLMAFGSGVLICALTFGLMEEAFKHGGFDAVVIGFLAGGTIFIFGDYLLHRLGGKRRHRHQFLKNNNQNNLSGGGAMTFGAILDGVPESIALGVALFNNQNTGFLMLAAIFLSNFPEGVSSVSELLKSGYSKSKIILFWILIGLVLATISVLSYIFLRDIDKNTTGIIEAFAAGAILAMLADSMMPEAFEEGGFLIGFLTVFGFLMSFILSRI